MRRQSFSVFFAVLAVIFSLNFVSAHGGAHTIVHLAGDLGFWLFLFANIVGISIVVWALVKLFSYYHVPSKKITKRFTKGLIALFVMTLAYQIFHHMEHIAQEYQYSFLRLSAAESDGILWFLNLEWNHFIFNFGYYLGLIVIAIFLYGVIRSKGKGRHTPVLFLLGSILLFQGWHVVEHTVRVVKHVTTGCEPCQGIVDSVFGFGLIHLHFFFNSVALILPLVLFFWYGFHRVVFRLVSR